MVSDTLVDGEETGETRSHGRAASNAEGTDSLTIRRALELKEDGLLGDAFAERIRDYLLELLVSRGPGRTICVSEAAQAFGNRSGYHWHDLMRPVRIIAAQLAEAGLIEALQQEEIVDIRVARGPVRLRLRALPGQRSAHVG